MGDFQWKRSQARAFLQPSRNPAQANIYLGCARVGGYTKPFGDLTPVYCPSPDRYGAFDVVDSIRGEAGLVTTSVDARFGLVNHILDRDCEFDLDVHYGVCEQPSDYLKGWQMILKFEKANVTEESSDELSALEPGDEAKITLTANISSQTRIFINRMDYSEKAASETTPEVVDVAVCDYLSCGDCGWESNGCQHLFALTKAVQGSPYSLAKLLESQDGGDTWTEWDVDTLLDQDPNAMACVGNRVAVVSDDSTSLHWAEMDDLDSWSEVTGVFNAAGRPKAIFALAANQVWIVGEGGYIYFTDDITTASSYEVQDAGVASGGQDLLAVHAVDSQNVVAVGVNGEVVRTTNGGKTWQAAATLPSASTLRAVWMRTAYHWLVGGDEGYLYFTLNAGMTWTRKAFSGDGAGVIYDLGFYGYPDSSVGAMAYTYTGGATDDGRLYRTIDNGNNWYLSPEEASLTIPTNLKLTALAFCRDPNFLLAGGLRSGADGIVVVGSA